ncbi:hypothetical protein YQE_00811, partial [Dendroctonus ponderosae]
MEMKFIMVLTLFLYSVPNSYSSIHPGNTTHDPKVTDLGCLAYRVDGTTEFKMNYEDAWTQFTRRTQRNEDIDIMVPSLYTKALQIKQIDIALQNLVETVGDKYMAVSGLPNPSKTHAKNIAKLALDMMDLGSSVIFDGEPVRITIGIHSGEVVTGVIGQRMPRYCLYGNTVNLTSRTETTGDPGKINVSEDAY